MKSNDSPEIPVEGETSNTLGLPSGVIKAKNSRGEYEAEHKTVDVHAYIHNQEVTDLSHLISEPFVELHSEADECIA